MLGAPNMHKRFVAFAVIILHYRGLPELRLRSYRSEWPSLNRLRPYSNWLDLRERSRLQDTRSIIKLNCSIICPEWSDSTCIKDDQQPAVTWMLTVRHATNLEVWIHNILAVASADNPIVNV